jgi:MFS family permease
MAQAASDASMVPIGWVIGCPLLGYVSDRIGRRKPVLIVGGLVMLAAGFAAVYLPEGALPRYSVPLVLGIGSGAAMIPFTMIKEANPSEVKGTASGVMNFLVFLVTGLMSPFVSRLMTPSSDAPLSLHEFQEGFLPLIVGIVLAILLSFVIRETGTANRSVATRPATDPTDGALRAR